MKKKIIFFLMLMLSMTTVDAGINVDYEDGIYHAVLTGKKVKKQIQFISSSNLITNKETHNKSASLLTINTGFFDPKNQKTIRTEIIIYGNRLKQTERSQTTGVTVSARATAPLGNMMN